MEAKDICSVPKEKNASDLCVDEKYYAIDGHFYLESLSRGALMTIRLLDLRNITFEADVAWRRRGFRVVCRLPCLPVHLLLLLPLPLRRQISSSS